MKHSQLLVLTGFVIASVLPACSGSNNAPQAKSSGENTGAPDGAIGHADEADSGAALAGFSQEYTFQTTSVSVPPGGEVYKCQDFTNPFGMDIGIKRIDTTLPVGAHHMFAFVMPNDQLDLKNGIADCPGGGLEFHEYITASASPTMTTTYPPGIGRMLNAGNGLRLMVHLLNTGSSPRDASITVQLRYGDPSLLQQRAATLFLINSQINVPPGKSQATATYTLPTDIWLLGAASHMHSRGIDFVATADTGDTLYQGTDWAEPRPKIFQPALPLKSGTKITFTCTYQNNSSITMTFGESAATNEMCNFPAEFYNTAGQQLTAIL